MSYWDNWRSHAEARPERHLRTIKTEDAEVGADRLVSPNAAGAECNEAQCECAGH